MFIEKSLWQLGNLIVANCRDFYDLYDKTRGVDLSCGSDVYEHSHIPGLGIAVRQCCLLFTCLQILAARMSGLIQPDNLSLNRGLGPSTSAK